MLCTTAKQQRRLCAPPSPNHTTTHRRIHAESLERLHGELAKAVHRKVDLTGRKAHQLAQEAIVKTGQECMQQVPCYRSLWWSLLVHSCSPTTHSPQMQVWVRDLSERLRAEAVRNQRVLQEAFEQDAAATLGDLSRQLQNDKDAACRQLLLELHVRLSTGGGAQLAPLRSGVLTNSTLSLSPPPPPQGEKDRAVSLLRNRLTREHQTRVDTLRAELASQLAMERASEEAAVRRQAAADLARMEEEVRNKHAEERDTAQAQLRDSVERQRNERLEQLQREHKVRCAHPR